MSGGMLKGSGSTSGFTITPHKMAMCCLIQIYAPPAQISYPFSSLQLHNRLGLFLFALTKSCGDIFEPKFDELLNQLREVGGHSSNWLIDPLMSKISSLLSPDDLFNFFSDMRGILGGPDTGAIEDDQILLDPNSNLGMFLRRCILAFNMLPFEGVCHLLTNIKKYHEDGLSRFSSFELPHMDDSNNDLEALSQYENMDLENIVYEKVAQEIEQRKRASKSVPFHFHVPKALSAVIEDIEVSDDHKLKHDEKAEEAAVHAHPLNNAFRGSDSSCCNFLNTKWQIQGYLAEQADALEKHGSSFPLNAFELILRQLQKLAPNLHRAHFLRYLNNLNHDEYCAALENIHCYFDYSAGTEGFDIIPPLGCTDSGRYELALVYMGMMHIHFGHPKQALEVLTEAVRVSQQQSNDICLAYALAAICNLLSEIGISSATGILGPSQSPMTSMGTSLPVQQQLFVLLKGSLKRAESLKLKRLEASNHLAMAKFYLTHVQRPLLSFGPKASMKLRNSPIDVCKELRLSYRLITDFGSETPLMTTDGALSTSWLKNLQKPLGSIFSNDSESTHSICFCAQPSSIPGSVLQLVGSTYLVRATAWEIYGSSPLARINPLIYATCFPDSSSSSDAELVYVKLIQHLAVFKGYKDAFSALKRAEEKFYSISKSRILLLKLQLLHEYALHRGCLKLAQRVCDELGVMVSSATGVDLDLKIEASLRHVRTLLAAKQFSQAASVAHSLFCMCYKFNLQVENATVLLLLAEIHKKSGNAVMGLPYALASLSFCQSFNLDLLKASANLTLAELWLELGSTCAKRALNLIHGALPMILGHGGLELRARAFIAEAKCYLSDPCFSVVDNAELLLDPLRQASEELEVLEYHELAAEAFYLMALIFDKMGQLEEREEAASSFKKHTIALDNPQDDEGDIFSMT